MPKKLVEPAKLLVYETPKSPKANGEYSIAKIRSELGMDNVLWVEEGRNISLDCIWDSLT